MQLVTIGTKNQIVIPKEVRKKIKGLTPGAKVSVYARGNEVVLKAEEKDWVKNSYGFMKDAWKGIDTTAYLEKLRDEWDEK